MSALTLYWDRLGDAQPEVVVPVSSLTPNYGLVTTVTVDDGTAFSPPSVTTTSYFSDPALGLPLTTTVNPGGLALATTNTFESYAIGAASGRRLKSRSMPSGSSWIYDYWGNNQVAGTVDTTCAQGLNANQAGLLRKKTHPGGLLAEEYVYDVAGRQVGYRKNGDPWTCSTYNARGELTQVVYPAIAGFSGSARTLTFNRGVATTLGPFSYRTWRSSVSDPSVDSALCSSGACGTMVADEDWMGRQVGYHDGTTQTVNTFDGAGRLVSTSSGGAGLVREYGYDSASRLSTVKLNGATLSTSAYDGNGELSSVTYGNSTVLSSIVRDGQGRTKKLTWTKGGATIGSDEITVFSQSGRIRTSTAMVGAASVASDFRYDGAGRLIKAIVGPTTYDYSFAASGCASPAVGNAGLNSNRTSVSTNGSTVAYCYNAADRVISGTGLGTVSYNSHGDTTALGGATYSWDVAGRNVAWTGAGVTTTYVRDASDRVRRRVLSGGWSEDWRPGYDGPGDAVAFNKTAGGVLAQIVVALPGGVTHMASISPVTSEPSVWSYPDLRGNTLFSTDGAGTVTVAGLQSYSPDGKPRAAVFDTNYVGKTFYGWHGQAARPQEQNGDLIQMGARPYLTTLGRFLSVDPVEAGTENDYTHPTDPINQTDLTGRRCGSSGCSFPALSNLIPWKKRKEQVRFAAELFSIVPGPAGAGASAVLIQLNLVDRKYKDAVVGTAALAVTFVGGKATVEVIESTGRLVGNEGRAAIDFGWSIFAGVFGWIDWSASGAPGPGGPPSRNGSTAGCCLSTAGLPWSAGQFFP
jgi:RHS repeat-associated protein